MARIRSIKPEFCQSESLGKVTREARLLFVNLWTIVDDEGRARGASRMLASLLFPYDDDAPSLIDGWLKELEDKGAIRRYVVDNSTYLDIPQWKTHQKIDHAAMSRLPSFEDADTIGDHRKSSRGSARKDEVLAPDLGPRTKDLGDSSLRSLSAREIEKLSDEFYQAYPKHVDPADARAKFAKRVKSGVDPNHIIAAAKRLAAAHKAAGTAKNFIPAPAVWLNKGGYDSEDLPRAPPSRFGDDTWAQTA